MTRQELLSQFQSLTDAELKTVWEFAEAQIKRRGFRTREAFVTRCVREQLEAKPKSRWPDWMDLADWLKKTKVYGYGGWELANRLQNLASEIRKENKHKSK